MISREIIKIDNINLKKNCLYHITHKDFKYAEIDGVADIIGWHIIVFYKNNSFLPSAIFVKEDENEDENLRSISNELLNQINFNIKIGDRLYDAIHLLGNQFYKDDFLDDIIMYHFFIQEDFWITLGVKNSFITSIELIFDNEIINSIKDVRLS